MTDRDGDVLMMKHQEKCEPQERLKVIRFEVDLPIPDAKEIRATIINGVGILLKRDYWPADFNPDTVETGSTIALPFLSKAVPKISIEDYVKRICVKDQNISIAAMTVSLVYLRAIHLTKRVPVNPLTIHRLFLASILIAVKFMDDFYSNNTVFARRGGIDPAEMCLLEKVFFGDVLKFNCCPSTTEYNIVLRELYATNV